MGGSASVRHLWQRFRRFWLEEEIPRWLGMMLVGVYVVGFGALACSAVVQTRQETRRLMQRAGQHAVSLLATRLGELEADDQASYQKTLREFSRFLRCEQLRVVNDQRVVTASIAQQEIGKPHPWQPGMGTMHPRRAEQVDLPRSPNGAQRVLFRAPIGSAPQGPMRFVEAITMVVPGMLSSAYRQTWVLAIVLLATGALFLAYRQLRRHFQGMAHIAGNLLTHRDRFEQDLGALRISDSMGEIAVSWNRLIDIADGFRSEARRAAAAVELRRALERSSMGDLAEALHALPDGVLFIVDSGTVAYGNGVAGRLLGWKPDKNQRTALADIKVEPQRRPLMEAITGALGSGGTFDNRNTVVEFPDEESSYRVRVLPLHRRRTDAIVVMSDISQQIRADKAREDFVNQVTHELRTPLTNIRAYTETLSSGMFEDPKVIADCYNVITKETRRLSRLIEDILNVSQVEVGTMQLVMDDVDLRPWITEAVTEMRRLAEEKNIDLQLALPAKIDPVRADRDKLAVVLNNLLGNALKYTPPGGSVVVGCQSSERELTITVKDTGMGIDVADQERIFEKFQRGANPEVQEETGTGIGLTTAREITRRHGGDIELISALGKGSTFIIRLPIRRSSPNTEPAARRETIGTQ